MASMARRAVVTGASGFVGAAAARALVRGGWRVLAVVRPTSDLGRLAGVDRDALELLPLDTEVADHGRVALGRALAAFAPEAVLHAAWWGVRGPERDDPAQVRNVDRTVAVVAAAAAAGARRFVGVGSQAEYGPRGGAITEGDLPAPRTLYGAAKLAAGQLALALARRQGLSAAWARVFSVYGPGERAGALIPDLVRALARGEPFPLSACTQRWDFLYEDDAGRALALLLDRSGAEGVFNVASGDAPPLATTVRAVAARVAPGAPLAFGALPGPVEDLVADVRRLRAAVGFSPEVPLDEGLRRTCAALLP